MAHPCELKEQDPQPVLSVRARGPVGELPKILGQAYGAIARYLGELEEQPVGPPFAAYYNMDMQDLDMEIGFPVARALPGKDEIQASEIPGGKAAICTHTGPYSEIEPTYNALFAWIDTNKYEVTGVVYEMYLNDPAETPPEELQTRIFVPLKPS